MRQNHHEKLPNTRHSPKHHSIGPAREIYWKIFLNTGTVLLLILHYNMQQQHIIQVILMINLMVFKEKDEKCNLLNLKTVELKLSCSTKYYTS